MAAETLGDRMKRYEAVTTSATLIRRLPVIIRVDGRAFHTWTRGLRKPFDDSLTAAMCKAAMRLLHEVQGGQLAYVQSDEASLLVTDTATLTTQLWLGYDLQKVVSLSAATMTATFNRELAVEARGPATFDARAFNLPLDEVANYFLWRVKDAHRNAILGTAQTVLSHREMQGKKTGDLLAIPEVAAVYADLRPGDTLGRFLLPGGCATAGEEVVEAATYEAVAGLIRVTTGLFS